MGGVYTEGNRIRLISFFLTPHTKGSAVAGSLDVTVVDPTGLAGADPVFLEGAGPEGGDLLTTIASIAGNVVTLTTAVSESVDLVRFGKRVAPSTITFKVKQPPRAGGTLETFLAPHAQITNPALGKYVLEYDPPSHGTYRWRADGTGTAAGAEEDSFVVERSEIV
jgi:hypothetical protein